MSAFALFRPRAKIACVPAVLFFLSLAFPALADRVVVDQLGRGVTLPDTISRAVVLEHHALDVVVELGAQDQVVAVMRDWQKQLGKGFERLAPQLKSLPEPGGLTEVNSEELLSLNPDVVIVTHYVSPAMLKQLEDTKIPVIQVAFFTVPESERGKLNPVLSDEKKAYTDGLLEGVSLLGEVFGKQAVAKQLNDVIIEKRKIIDERTANLPEEGRTTLYMANPDMNTYGAGKYTGVIMEQAGGLNVARGAKGYGKVTMEQVLSWNPAIIIVQDRYAEVADQIRQDPAWKTVKAVADDKIFITPEYVKPWGHPVPESVALGELWMAKILHPDLFQDIDINSEAQKFYKAFYRTDYVAK